MGTLCVNDRKDTEGRIERTQPMVFSADEPPTAASAQSTHRNSPAGWIRKVTVEIKQ
jgi:arylsulfatase